MLDLIAFAFREKTHLLKKKFTILLTGFLKMENSW